MPQRKLIKKIYRVSKIQIWTETTETTVVRVVQMPCATLEAHHVTILMVEMALRVEIFHPCVLKLLKVALSRPNLIVKKKCMKEQGRVSYDARSKKKSWSFRQYPVSIKSA